MATKEKEQKDQKKGKGGEKKGGKNVNTVVKTYPNVSQFWTYGKDEFLKNPVYSRDFPPAKNLE